MKHSQQLIASACGVLMMAAVIAAPLPTYAAGPTFESNPVTLLHYFTTSVKTAATAAYTSATAVSANSLAVKEYNLDPLAYALAQASIRSLTNSTVRWINSGFQGSPAYATDLKTTMLDAADQTANVFVNRLQHELSVNSPFRDKVAQKILRSYLRGSSNDGFFLQNPYTLNKVSPDDAAFLRGDFTKGGFQAWFAATLHQQNNPIGATNLAQSQLDDQIDAITGQIHEELGWGNGIFSWRKCDTPAPSAASSTGSGVNLSAQKTCFSSHIETPGSVIAGQLNHALGLGADSLVSADEINEIVGALMGQLMNHVLGSDGLGGLSHASAASGGRTYFDQTDSSVSASTGTSSTGGTGTVSVISSLLQIIQTQQQQIQAYVANWQKISDAAASAKTALQKSTCVPNADALITAKIQPVMTQAATAIGNASTQLNALEKIRSEALAAAAQTGSQQAAGLQQANTDYNALTASNALPTADELTYASDQALPTQSDQAPSLITQMAQLSAQAACTPTTSS